jgi:hypothetical protein
MMMIQFNPIAALSAMVVVSLIFLVLAHYKIQYLEKQVESKQKPVENDDGTLPLPMAEGQPGTRMSEQGERQ